MRFLPFIACLLAACLAAESARAVVGGEEWGEGAYITQACSDTVMADASSVRAAALRALEHDRWILAGDSCPHDGFLTQWKTINTPLVRVLIGKITARCLVTVEPLDDERSAVSIRAAMMTKNDITRSPAFPTAQRAWHRTARKYLRDVRELLVPEEAATR